MKCKICDEDISEKVKNYSISKYGIALCYKCQQGYANQAVEDLTEIERNMENGR